MLPIPVFLLLVFSVAILAPAPVILIHLMKAVSLSAPPSHISTMPALPSAAFLPPAEKTLYLPVPDPQPTLDVASVCRGQSLVDMAINSTTPLLQAHEASGYTTRTTILPVVVLAIIGCLVYRLLVVDTNGTRSEKESEQPMPCQPAHLAHILSEESAYYYTTYETLSPWPVIDTNISTTASLELSDVVTAPSYLEMGRGSRFSALLEQPSQFPVFRHGALAGGVSKKATDHNSSLATLSVSGCTSSDDWMQGPTTQSTDSKESSPAPISLVAAIKYSELVPPQCGPLDIEVIDLSSVPLSQEPERQSEPQDNSNPSSAIEAACVHEAFLPYDHESDDDDDDDDETFDYKGVDWEPSTSGVPTPSPAAEICATASPYSSPKPHVERSRTPSKAEQESTSSFLSTSTPKQAALGSSTIYASDDIQMGVKSKKEAKIAYITRRRIRCASVDDLRGMVDPVQATRVPDSDPVISLHNIADQCISINQVALLRADLPVFTPRTSAMSAEVASSTGPPQPVFVGLKASIHAPRNDDLSLTQTQECVANLDAIKQASSLPIESQTRCHSAELVSLVKGNQESTHSASKPDSREPAYPVAAESSTSQASGLESSTLASAETDARAIQTPKEPAEIPAPTTRAIIGPNAPCGLAASMHAPQVRLPSQTKREIAGHSADAPNWAAAAREDSTAASRGSSLAQRRKTPNQGSDDGEESDVPTTARCTIQDENEGSGVDDSDVGGSMRAADDRDGPAGSYETDSGLDAADDSNEQESAARSRRRGKPRRQRTKVPYLPPPRMRNLTQHPIVDMLVEAQALHRLAAAGPAVSNGQHYPHTLSQQSHPVPVPVLGPFVPPQATVSDWQPLGYHQTQQQHTGSPSTTDFQPSHIPSLQLLTSPAPYYPILYPQNSHGERTTPLMSSPLPYGR